LYSIAFLVLLQAMVYLHEIADPRYKAVTGSLGYVSLGVGVVIGILVVVMIISLVPAGASYDMFYNMSQVAGPMQLPQLLGVAGVVGACRLR
jgi:uncharacterized membrane protein